MTRITVFRGNELLQTFTAEGLRATRDDDDSLCLYVKVPNGNFGTFDRDTKAVFAPGGWTWFEVSNEEEK